MKVRWSMKFQILFLRSNIEENCFGYMKRKKRMKRLAPSGNINRKKRFITFFYFYYYCTNRLGSMVVGAFVLQELLIWLISFVESNQRL